MGPAHVEYEKGYSPEEKEQAAFEADATEKMNSMADEERRRVKGRAATILTGGTGLLNQASSARKVLLGS